MPDERQTEDVKAAAAILGVHPQTLYEAIKHGTAPFPVVRVGGRILIPRAALERLVADGVVADGVA
jgi:excisionase family DNA binding protein